MCAVQPKRKPRVTTSSVYGLIDAGCGHLVPVDRIYIVFSASGREATRIRHSFRDRGMVLDFTGGAKTHSMLLLQPGGHLVLSPKTTLAIRTALEEWYYTPLSGKKGK